MDSEARWVTYKAYGKSYEYHLHSALGFGGSLAFILIPHVA